MVRKKRDHTLFVFAGISIVQDSFRQLRQLVETKSTFVLTTHVNPDGDGLGSQVALASFLRGRGKKPFILNHSPLPSYYDFLNRNGDIVQYRRDLHESIVKSADVILMVDTNHPDRVGSVKDVMLASGAAKVIIDHHLDPASFASLAIIDDGCAATGEIVFRFLSTVPGFSFSREIATALYAAIMTDTGSFRFPKTDGDLHRAVGVLIDSGADPVQVYEDIYDRAPISRLHLLGRVLNDLKVTHGGQVAYCTIPRSAFTDTGTSEEDAERFVTYTLGIQGVRIGLMFTELDGVVKVSFRSKGDIWINKLAKEFGGNGHKNAAGARIPGGNLSTILTEVLEHSKRYV